MKPSIVLTTAFALIFLCPGLGAPDELSDMTERIEQLEQTIRSLKNEVETLKDRQRGGEEAAVPEMEEEMVFEEEEPFPEAEEEMAFDTDEEAVTGAGEFGAPADEGGGGEFGAAGGGGEFGAGGTEQGSLDLALEDELVDIDEMKEEPAPGGGATQGLKFGGHLKLYLADRSEGERNGIDQNNNLSAGVHNLFIYMTKNLNDWLRMDVQTNTGVTSGATPRLGTDISRDTNSDINTKISEAAMAGLLPYGIEFRAGLFDPLYSEEYAKQLWWHQQYHGNNGLLRLQEWHDIGVEVYKNFDLGPVSLPTYFYLLNGDDSSTFILDSYNYVDNNGGMSGLVHVAPEFRVPFLSRFRLMGSLGYGKWDPDDDNDAYKTALGVDMGLKSFTLMSEYMYKEFEDIPLTNGGVADGEQEGYYIKGLWDITSRWRMVAKFSHVELYEVQEEMLTDTYDSYSFGINYFVTDSSTIMPQIMYTDADRSDGSEELEYFRFTLGWRTTF